MRGAHTDRARHPPASPSRDRTDRSVPVATFHSHFVRVQVTATANAITLALGE